MKTLYFILILLPGISFNISAQTAGDYRSVGNGNWNDATKWERYNGSNWVSTSVYPGQQSGAGIVSIMKETEIKLTATVSNPVASLFISVDDPTIVTKGVLAFSAATAITLTVSGDIELGGELRMDNQIGAKTHTLSIGGNLHNLAFSGSNFQTINQDDKLAVTFNSTVGDKMIWGEAGFAFQDITINGMGIWTYTFISVAGTATFINGYIRTGMKSWTNGMDISDEFFVMFDDGSMISGASNASFIDGTVSKSGVEPFTFPIGSQGFYAPLTISGIEQPEQFYAKYGRGESSGQPITDPELYSLSTCEYWQLFRDDINAINPSIDVTVGWSSATRCGSSSYISNASDVVLAFFDAYTFSSHGGIGTGTTTNGSVTVSDFYKFGRFTLGNLEGCRPPSPTISNIGAVSATVSWPAVPGALSYDVDYNNINTSWINVTTTTTSTTANLTGLTSLTIYDLRVSANCSSGGSSYRPVQFTTLFDCGEPGGLWATNITSNSATLTWTPVVNATNYRVEFKKSTETIWNSVFTGTTSFSHNLNGLLASTAYDWRVGAQCPSGTWNYTATSFTTAICNDFYELNNSSSQAKAISSGNIISANIFSVSDVDWFKITTPNNANTNLDVRLSNLPADYDLYVYNKSLKLIGSSVALGTSNEMVIYNSTARKATYYIKVAGKNGVNNSSQCYTLLAQALSIITGPLSSVRVNEITGDQNEPLLYPNPASEFVYLSFNSTIEGKGNVQVLNSSGQLLKQSPVRVNKGFNQVKIPINEISPGLYLLTITRGELIMKKKFVIAR